MASTNATQLDALARDAAPNSVSILMPTHQAGRENRQDPIRLKSLLADAEKQLVELGQRRTDAAELIEKVHNQLEDDDFWRHQSKSLGVFFRDGSPQIVKLPVAVSQVVSVCDHYHVKPLFSQADQNGTFYLLALSENSVRLFRADRFEIEPVELPDLPDSFGEFLRFDDPERHLEYHSGTAQHQGSGGRPAVYHGQGAAGDKDSEKTRLRDYCRQIASEVARQMQNSTSPLILAGTEPIQGIFRQVFDRDNLAEVSVEGNPDRTDLSELREQAVALLSDHFHQAIQADVDRFHQARNADLAVTDLADVIRAGEAKAIDTLFVPVDEQQWGAYDSQTHRVTLHESAEAGDEDLQNLAAVLAYQGGATIHALPREQMPVDAPAAAILRFRPEG